MLLAWSQGAISYKYQSPNPLTHSPPSPLGELVSTVRNTYVNPHRVAQFIYLFIYYESTKRKLKTKCICGCRCYERLQPKTKEFTRLSYTELVLEHLKIDTRLITEIFANVMGECEN